MASTLAEQIAQAKRETLSKWQARYSREEYPQKLVENLLYESLTMDRLWPELKQAFMKQTNKKNYASFDEAFDQIYARRRNVQTDEILPTVKQLYATSNKVISINFAGLRDRVVSAQRGDSKMFEEVQYSYFYYTFTYELIYAWSAAGLFGLSEADAVAHVAGIQASKAPESLESLIKTFGIVASLHYSSSV